MNQKPIGIFDSGIGGLTVAQAISKLLPEEKIIYFGDTAHLPYGDKSKELVREYALGIAEFLIQIKHCKCIVIACNTASAAAYEILRDAHKANIPIFNVIDPMVEAVVADANIKRVGLIATRTTVESGVYQEKFARRKPGLKVQALATPLLAPMIEEGFYNNTISHAVIEGYLNQPELAGIDALILGCTHYVMIRKQIEEFYQQPVKIFDSSDLMASKIKTILSKEDLLCPPNVGFWGNDEFLVSDLTESFEKSARSFYGQELFLQLQNIWKK